MTISFIYLISNGLINYYTSTLYMLVHYSKLRSSKSILLVITFRMLLLHGIFYWIDFISQYGGQWASLHIRKHCSCMILVLLFSLNVKSTSMSYETAAQLNLLCYDAYFRCHWKEHTKWMCGLKIALTMVSKHLLKVPLQICLRIVELLQQWTEVTLAKYMNGNHRQGWV